MSDKVATELSDTVNDVIAGMTSKRTNASDKTTRDRNINCYRTQYNSFLRTVWRRLPNIDQYIGSEFTAYACTEPYDVVVTEVAKTVHQFLFNKQESLCFEEFQYKTYGVIFPSVACKVLLITTFLLLCIFCLAIANDIKLSHQNMAINATRAAKKNKTSSISSSSSSSRASSIGGSTFQSSNDDDNSTISSRNTSYHNREEEEEEQQQQQPEEEQIDDMVDNAADRTSEM